VQRNVALNEFRSGLKASTLAVASYVRTELHTALRKNPYQVNLLIAGYDGASGGAGAASGAGAGAEAGAASLYFVDYLGSSQKMDFAAHGYASYFIFSTMDRHWRAGMSLPEALDLVRMCVRELKTRFLVNQPNWTIKVCDELGTRVVDFSL
jgi:hypothetical protein